MRVALDLSPLERPFPVSVVRTVRPIVDELRSVPGIEILPIRPPAGVRLALWRQRGLVREARAARAEVLHSFTSAFSLSRALPVVQTVHELPWRHGSGENAGFVHRGWVRLGRLRAARTCTPSAEVAKDLLPHPRLTVVPWGVGREFCQEPSEVDAKLRSRVTGLPTPSGEPFVLALGATRPKKRLDLVCAGAEASGLRVVVTGEITRTVRALLEQHPCLVATGRVADEWIPALVRAAAAVAVLSTSEGFALPVLEALACGTPVVVAGGSVQAATAGDAGIAVDASSTADVARGFRDALEPDATRTDRGLEIAGTRRWSDTAAGLVDVWRSVR